MKTTNYFNYNLIIFITLIGLQKEIFITKFLLRMFKLLKFPSIYSIVSNTYISI